jgi:hypothetical protein
LGTIDRRIAASLPGVAVYLEGRIAPGAAIVILTHQCFALSTTPLIAIFKKQADK